MNEYDPTWGSFTPAYHDDVTPYDIPEDVSVGHEVVTIQATDDDGGADGTVSYELISAIDSEFRDLFIIVIRHENSVNIPI